MRVQEKKHSAASSSLALWVGGVVLVAVLNVDLTEHDRKKLGKANPVQLFFGRYLIFFVISQVQGLIIALGDLFFLKTQAEDPVMFIISCLISSFVYSLIIYSLTITFSVIGKALAVIILIRRFDQPVYFSNSFARLCICSSMSFSRLLSRLYLEWRLKRKSSSLRSPSLCLLLSTCFAVPMKSS